MSPAREFHQRVAAAVACGFCGAVVGDLCRTGGRGRGEVNGRAADRSGAEAQGPHSARVDEFGRAVR